VLHANHEASLFRQRKKTNEEAPRRVLCYGNVFVLACAENTVKDLVVVDLHRGLEVVQEAKASLEDKGYIRSMIDLLEDKTVRADLSTRLVAYGSCNKCYFCCHFTGSWRCQCV